jgi:hypothetical protein
VEKQKVESANSKEKAESRKQRRGAKWEGQRSKDERREQKAEVRKHGARSGGPELPTSNTQRST